MRLGTRVPSVTRARVEVCAPVAQEHRYGFFTVPPEPARAGDCVGAGGNARPLAHYSTTQPDVGVVTTYGLPSASVHL